MNNTCMGDLFFDEQSGKVIWRCFMNSARHAIELIPETCPECGRPAEHCVGVDESVLKAISKLKEDLAAARKNAKNWEQKTGNFCLWHMQEQAKKRRWKARYHEVARKLYQMESDRMLQNAQKFEKQILAEMEAEND